MALRLRCKCGEQVMASDESVGQTVRCPRCNALLRVPDVRRGQAGPPAAPPPQPAPPGYAPQPPGNPWPQGAAVTGQPPAPYGQYPAYPPGAFQAPPQQYPPGPYPPGAFAPGMEVAPYPEGGAPGDAGMASVLPEEDPGEHDNKKYRRKKQQERDLLKTTRVGMLLINIGTGIFLAFVLLFMLLVTVLCLMVSVALLGAVSAAASSTHFSRASLASWMMSELATLSTVVLLLMIPLVLLPIVANLILLVGKIMCCWVPRRAKANKLMVSSLICDASALVLLLICPVLVSMGPRWMAGAQGQAIQSFGFMSACLAVVALFISFTFLMRFIKAIAEFLGASRAIHDGMDAFALVLGAGILWLILTVAMAFLPPIVIFVIARGIVMTVYSIWLGVMLVLHGIRLMKVNGALQAKMAAF